MTRPDLTAAIDATTLAQRFHEAYERLAPSFGYETREASAKPWAEVPENNRALMTAVCAELLPHLRHAWVERTAQAIEERASELTPGARKYRAFHAGLINAVRIVREMGETT